METTQTITQPDAMIPFPYHPNTLTYRYTYASYHDLHQRADEAMGQFIRQLKEDGLMDDTFIFYFGDHGGVLPRSKGYIYESGLHVPLVVFVPEKYKHLVPIDIGMRTDAFVQFIDFGPTVLNLAGIPIPSQMDGKPFLGKGITSSELALRITAFSYADRFDEKYDLVRAYRKGKYKYIRNYQPFNVDALFNFYRYKMLAYQEWKELFNRDELNEFQQRFFRARKAEELYDLEQDPHEVQNLAGNPSYHSVLEELRGELQKQVKSMPDLSFIPEPYFLERGLSNPVKFGQEQKGHISSYVDIADLSLRPFSVAKKDLAKALESNDPWKRYWGLIVCTSFGNKASSFYEMANKIVLKDSENLVVTRALEFLALTTDQFDELAFLTVLKKAKTKTEANLILNTVALIKTLKPDFRMTISKSNFKDEWVKSEQDLISRRIQFVSGQ